MNVFMSAMVRIFSFGERWNVPFNEATAELNGTFHLSPNENILTIALIKTFIICITIHLNVLCSITCTGNEEKDTPDKGTSDNDAVKSCGKFSYCM